VACKKGITRYHVPMDRPLMISITPGTLFTAVLVGAGVLLAYALRDLLLVVLTAVVLASAIESSTVRMMRWGCGRVVAVTLIYLVGGFLLLALFYFFIPPLLHEANSFAASLPTYLETLKLPSMGELFSGDLTQGGTQVVQLQNILKQSSAGVLSAASTLFGGLSSFVLIVVLSFYLAVQEQGIDDFLRLVTPTRHHRYILDLWRRAQHKIGRWLQGQILLSVIVGTMVFLGLVFFHVEHAALLALAAGVLELVPVFGSILAALPAVALSYVQGGASLAFLVILVYLVVNQLEGNVIYPLVVQKVVGVSPLVVILAILAGFQLAGVLGVLIAVPVAAGVQEYVRDVQKGKQHAYDAYVAD